MKTYPINLVLDNRLVVLVGAQGEIVHKIPALLECGARIRIVEREPANDVAFVCEDDLVGPGTEDHECVADESGEVRSG